MTSLDKCLTRFSWADKTVTLLHGVPAVGTLRFPGLELNAGGAEDVASEDSESQIC